MQTRPNLATLRRLRTLSQFSDDQLTQLAENLTIQTAGKRTRLIELGCSEHFSLYLLQGSVSMTARDGGKKEHHSESSGELNPVAQIRPCMYDVDVINETTYLKINADQLTRFAHQVDEEEQFEVVAIEQTKEENELTMQLFRDMTSDNVNLPSLPDVARCCPTHSTGVYERQR